MRIELGLQCPDCKKKVSYLAVGAVKHRFNPMPRRHTARGCFHISLFDITADTRPESKRMLWYGLGIDEKLCARLQELAAEPDGLSRLRTPTSMAQATQLIFYPPLPSAEMMDLYGPDLRNEPRECVTLWADVIWTADPLELAKEIAALLKSDASPVSKQASVP